MTATIVLTEPGASVHQPGLIERALTASGLTGGETSRFDLLTFPDFRELNDVDNPDFASLVAADVRQIAERRGTTRLIVAVQGDPAPFVARFREGTGWYRGLRLKTHGINLLRFAEHAPMTRLLVTDADHRMHGRSGGLMNRIVHAHGPASYGVLAVAGGGAALAERSLRQAMAAAGIKMLRRREPELKEIVVTSSFETAAAYPDAVERLKSLSRDTERAASFLSAEADLPAVPLIAMVGEHRLLRFRAPVC